MRWELRLSNADLAIALGAVVPTSVEEHKRMLNSGQYILIREQKEGRPLLWKVQPPLVLR